MRGAYEQAWPRPRVIVTSFPHNPTTACVDYAFMEQLVEFGARPTSRRVVEQGKVITAAGVSSGIDMALTLAARIAGDETAQLIQLGIEYDPEPPFSSGAPHKAPAHVLELARRRVRARAEAEAART